MNPSLSTAVIGLQYGDEGKGQVVDALCSRHDIVVRYNGGANAGHSVAIGNESFVLHQIPIGTLTPGRTNLLANGVVVSASELLEEAARLSSAGVDLSGLKVSGRAHLVMPWHLAEERLKHELARRSLGEAGTLGTTFKGIGPCYADKANRDTAIRVSDLFEPEALRPRLEFIVSVKNAFLGGLAAEAAEAFTPFDAASVFDTCMGWAKGLHPYVTDTAMVLERGLRQGERVLFEGANAALLDVDQGTYPFVTSSNGSTLGIESGAGLAVGSGLRRVGVAKAYMSRVGTGPFVTELHGDLATKLRELGNEYGSTTGRPRRIGWLDLPALAHVVTRNRIDALVLTGLHVLSSLDSFRVCIGYRMDGRPVAAMPDTASALERCEGEYLEIVVGEPMVAAADGTPASWVRELIALVETRVTGVSGICTGRRRDQVIWIHGVED